MTNPKTDLGVGVKPYKCKPLLDVSDTNKVNYLLQLTILSQHPLSQLLMWHWASAGNSVEVSFNVPLNGLKDESTGINEALTTSQAVSKTFS